MREGERSLRILLAEDIEVNQKLASRLLEKRGHKVVVVCNGREALEALDKESFDLVVMDAQMPEMDGFEATAAIRVRENETGAHIPIIAMTAYAMAGDRDRCLAVGMDGYISMPISTQELVKEIRRVRALPFAAATLPTLQDAGQVPAHPPFLPLPAGDGGTSNAGR